MSGRLVTNNTILAIESFHSMQVGYLYMKDPYMAVKLDIMKAYNYVEWGFLRGMLHKMEFQER